MKKLLTWAVMVTAIALSSCKYDDDDLWSSVHGLEDRVAKLEELCRQMNTNISSLQTIVEALQENDYVTSVIPIMQDGKEIGYTIIFSKSNPITIYHGKNGQDGQEGSDGDDGTTPSIGVKQDTDGIYYWTLNGGWLTDDHGNKIKAEGVDGNDGTDGEDGITPKFKIENDYWYISYNNGETWEQLGKATGEDGTEGDSMFTGIDYKTSTDYVIFTLADGTQIKLLTWSAFDALQRLCNETNTNLSSLQAIVTALQNNDYITSVDPLTEDGKVIGYTLKFAKSNPIVIYNGKDGADGNTPVIGVKEDTDGIYYWTLNGEFIIVDGQKINVQGTDGTTPKLEIQEGYWWISYNNGDSWERLGKATEEDGKDRESVKITQDENNVYFELENGTVITIPRIGMSISPEGMISFEDNYIRTICLRNWDTNDDGYLSLKEVENVTSLDQQFNQPYYIQEYKKEYLFYGNDALLSFPELAFFTKITAISGTEFANCKNLHSIILPETLQTIDNGVAITHENGSGGVSSLTKWFWGAFSNTALTNIVIPNNVTTIGRYAFYRCYNLKEVTIGESVREIGGYAFAHTNLQTIICKAQIPPTLLSNSISESVNTGTNPATSQGTFTGIDKTKVTLFVPISAIDAYKADANWSGFNIVGGL